MAYQKICQLKNCPEKTVGRVTDGGKRFDLCRAHFDGVISYYGDAVTIVEEWTPRPPAIHADTIDETIKRINAAREEADA